MRIKNCSCHYRNIKNIEFEQWTDQNIDIKEERRKFHEYLFIKRGSRIYRSKTKINTKKYPETRKVTGEIL